MSLIKTTVAVIAALAALSMGKPLCAQDQQSAESIPSQPESENTQVIEQLDAQKSAGLLASQASAYIKMGKKSAAARLLRKGVIAAMDKSDDWYKSFIMELNEQLELNNVLSILGLRQRPHAAANSVQYKAELALYGQRTLPASILAVIGSEAVKQGKLNDCWFLSTLAVVADDHPQLIPSMITVNEDASYLVKFPGYENKIHVKALAQNSTRAVGVRKTAFGDWPFVLECAATAVLPQQMLHGGKPDFALRLLLGVDSRTYALAPVTNAQMLSTADLSETIVAAVETKQTVIVATPLQSSLVPNHAYSVIDFVPANQEHGALVTIRNPWGRLGCDPRAFNSNEVFIGDDGRFTLPITLLGNYFDSITVPLAALRRVSLANENPASQIQGGYNNQQLPAVPRSYVNSNRSNYNSRMQNAVPANLQQLPSVPRSYVRN